MWVTWGLWPTFLPPRGQSTRGEVTITGTLLWLRLGQFGEWVCCCFCERCNLGSKWRWLSASRSTAPCPMALLLRGEEQPGPQTSPSGGMPQIHPLWKGCPGGMDPVGSSPSTNLVGPWLSPAASMAQAGGHTARGELPPDGVFSPAGSPQSTTDRAPCTYLLLLQTWCIGQQNLIYEGL